MRFFAAVVVFFASPSYYSDFHKTKLIWYDLCSSTIVSYTVLKYAIFIIFCFSFSLWALWALWASNRIFIFWSPLHIRLNIQRWLSKRLLKKRKKRARKPPLFSNKILIFIYNPPVSSFHIYIGTVHCSLFTVHRSSFIVQIFPGSLTAFCVCQSISSIRVLLWC